MATNNGRKLSIIIPALNEEQGIGKTINSIPRMVLESMGYHVQVLVVDNGSEDRTAEKAKNAGADVIYEPRRGYGLAYKTGFSHSSGDIIVTGDADLTYPVEDIPIIVKKLSDENLDFITTNRFGLMEKGAMSHLHRFGNGVLNTVMRLLFHLNLKDSQSGMWIFRKELLQEFKIKSNGMSLSEELKIEACYYTKCRWKEIPISYKSRVGKVKLRAFRDGFENLFFLVRKRIVR